MERNFKTGDYVYLSVTSPYSGEDKNSVWEVANPYYKNIKCRNARACKYFKEEFLNKCAFKPGDKVIVTDTKEKSTVTKVTMSNGYIEYFLEGFSSPKRASALEHDIEKAPKPELGSLVMYKTGTAVYRVITCKEDDLVGIEHIRTGATYTESDPNKLVKLKFQPGDKVEISAPSMYQGQIKTILSAEYRVAGVFYRLREISDIKFAEEHLKLAENLDFKKGDLVYVDHNRVENKEYCYKIFTIINSDDKSIGVDCEDENGNTIKLGRNFLVKPEFSIGEFIKYDEHIWTIQAVYFSAAQDVCYTMGNSTYGVMAFTEQKLKTIITPKLNKNENKLQGKTSPERGESDKREGRVHGRKPDVTVKIQRLSYQTITGRSQRETQGTQNGVPSQRGRDHRDSIRG